MSIRIQGTLHADGKDAHEFWTLFTLLFRLPPGADPGAFLLARPGTYIRETGELTLSAAFKGNDLHGRSAPYTPPEEMRKWEAEILKEIGTRFGVVKHVRYVSYPSTVGVKCTSALSVSPSVGFGNEPISANSEQSSHLNFVEHGRIFLGTAHSFYNRMIREQAMHDWNVTLKLQNVFIDINAYLASHSYEDENGETHACLPLEWNPRDDQAYVAEMRSRVHSHIQLAITGSAESSSVLPVHSSEDRRLATRSSQPAFKTMPSRPAFSMFDLKSTSSSRQDNTQLCGTGTVKRHKRGRSSLDSNLTTLPEEFNDEESDSEEELSEILDFDEKNNQYHVRWLGYDTQQDSWVKTSEIHASEMIQAFWQARGQEGPPLPLSSNERTQRRHHEKDHENTSLGEDISMNSLETAIGKVSSSAHEFTVQRLPEYDIQQSNEQTSEQAQTIISRSTMKKLGNTSLMTLFNSASLHSELEQLRSMHSKLERLPNDLQNPKQWLRGLAIQTQINEEIKSLPEEMIKALPVLEAAQAFTDMLNHALRWEICRAYFIFRWCTDIGPDLVYNVFDWYQEHGEAGIHAKYSQFAALTYKIVLKSRSHTLGKKVVSSQKLAEALSH
ncbi:hypothetical protein BKA93DRAFT_750754 [Sparassis latifolia]